MNLFFSSLAKRRANAKPIPEEQPVMSTTFFIAPVECLSCSREEEGRRQAMVDRRFKAPSLIRRSATQQEAEASWAGDYHGA